MATTQFIGTINPVTKEWAQDVNDLTYKGVIATGGTKVRLLEDHFGDIVKTDDISGVDNTGATDSAIALNNWFSTINGNAYIQFGRKKTYLIGSTSAPVKIKASNIVVDFNFSKINTGVAGDNAFWILPNSLDASGRYNGTDYPSSWKNGSTPLPMDSTAQTMMHESTDANRVKNVVIMNAICDSGCLSTFLNAFSVDNITFINCDIQPYLWSAIRLWHCTQINLINCTLGGSGSYTVFGFKCARPMVRNCRFVSTTSIRALSFKGVLHQAGKTIFQNNDSGFYQYFGGSVTGCEFVGGIDGVFWDTTPNYIEDAVGARGGSAIGFTSGQWYGKGSGFSVSADNKFNLYSANPGTNGGQQGRAVWCSAPHQDINIENNSLLDSIIFLTGVTKYKLGSNKFRFTKGMGYAWEVQGDSTTGLDGTDFSIFNNEVHDWQPQGTTTIAARIANSNGRVKHNSLHNPANGTTYFMGYGANYTALSNYIDVEHNRIFHTVGTPIVNAFGSNNVNGHKSDNVAFNTSTGAYSSDGLRVRDVGGAGVGVTASDDSTGYAGVALYNKAGTTIRAQWYWEASTNRVYYYALGNKVFETDGSTYLRPSFNNTYDLGGSGNYWKDTYTQTINVSTNGGIKTTNQTNGAGALTATFTNAPAAGNPTFWLPISINGSTKYIPCIG